MATVITYTANQLRNISSNARSKSFFPSFCLDRLMMSWIIALDIRSKPRPYRRSRGGKDHFYHIHTIIGRGTTRMQSTGLTKERSINQGIWQSLHIQHKTQIKNRSPFRCNGALINCKYVHNKTHEIQQTVEEITTDICVLTETWIKVGNNLTQLRLCPQGYKSILLPRKNWTMMRTSSHSEGINKYETQHHLQFQNDGVC